MNPFREKKEIRQTEERVIHRVTLSRVMDSVVDAFNLDRGLIYTLKRLFTVPGELARDFLYQGRYHYTPPFRMLIVSTTVVILLLSYSRSGMDIFQVSPEGATREESEMARDFLADYYNLFLWLFIPILSLFSWLFNRASKYNYAENMVFQTYLMVIGNLLYILMLLDYFLPTQVLMALYMLSSLTYSTIAYKQFFGKKWARSILETIIIYLLTLVVYGVISAFVIGVFVGYSKAGGA